MSEEQTELTKKEELKNKAHLKRLLLFTALLALIGATLCLTNPQIVMDYLDIDKDVTTYLGYALTFIGAFDIYYALVLLKQSDRK